MLKRPPKTVQQILAQGPLAELSKRTQQAEHLNALWQQAVSPALAAASKCIARNDDTLLIHVATAAWLTRIKLTESTIIQRFNQNSEAQVKHLDIRVKPELNQVSAGSK
ncbi:MAG: protein of unknown function DUF721 [Idiomarinaceae bacterium HL-53]|nr:MAG: protein of unknown function DUF721 [Idiomarinaceae bacterium HL-53]CUS47386.1 Protein of unknown function (DUF721) [Idiomarinaceae bacterium HL-53]